MFTTMTSLLNRFLQMRDKGREEPQIPRLPARPPRPNFEHLSPEEVEKMNEVITKLELMDRQESDNTRVMRESIQRFEEHQRRQLAERNRFFASSNYVCRLCFKTKFVEKTARVCATCGFKICSRCGLYTHDLVGGKQEMVRWRCRLCQLKREYACQTGHWYHGDAAQPVLEKDELWLAVQQKRNGSVSTDGGGRRGSEPALLCRSQFSHGRPVPDISINNGPRNPRDLSFFMGARGTLVAPRHPAPTLKRPPNEHPRPAGPPGHHRPVISGGKFQRHAMKGHFQTLPNKFGPQMQRSPSRDSTNSNSTAMTSESRESFRSDDSVFIHGSLQASKLLAQSSPNISDIETSQTRPGPHERRPVHRGNIRRSSNVSADSPLSSPKEVRDPAIRRGRAPVQKARARTFRSQSLCREQAISDSEDALPGMTPALSISELVAITGHQDWRASMISTVSPRESENSFDTDSSVSEPVKQESELSPVAPPRRRLGRTLPRQGSPQSPRKDMNVDPEQKSPHRPLELDIPRNEEQQTLQRSDSIKSRGGTAMRSESFDSDDFQYDLPYTPTRLQPHIQCWKRYPSTDDMIVFGGAGSVKEQKEHLYTKNRNQTSADKQNVDKSPVLTRIEWTPNRRRSCEVGASPMLRHLRMRNATSCGRISSGGSVSYSDMERESSGGPVAAHDEPTFNITLEAEDDEACISNFRRFGFRLAGGTINEAEEMMTVVAQVSPNYPAKVQGHLDKGDEILTWNGQDLTEKTYEEVLQIVDAPVSAITLTVKRNPEPACWTQLFPEDADSLNDSLLEKTADADLRELIEETVGSDAEDQTTTLDSTNEEADLDIVAEKVDSAPPELPACLPRSREGSVSRKWRSLTRKNGRRKSSEGKLDIRRPSQLSIGSTIAGKLELTVTLETDSVQVSLHSVQGLSYKYKDNHQVSNVVLMLRLLPKTDLHKPYQVGPRNSSYLIRFTDQINFHEVTKWQFHNGTVEVTVWEVLDDDKFEFLGEALVDLVDLCDREGKRTCYTLYEHDENSTELETPAPVEITVDQDFPSTASSASKASSSSPMDIRTSTLNRNCVGDSSFRSKMKKKMTTAIGKLSIDGKRDQMPPDGNRKALSPGDQEQVKKSPLLSRLKKSSNHSPSVVVTQDSPPSDRDFHPGPDLESQLGRGSDTGRSSEGMTRSSVYNSVEDLDDLDTDSEAGDNSRDMSGQLTDSCSINGNAERPTPEGDYVTNLGPGQICPKQGIDSASSGDLKLGVIMTKGQLEVHIMSARGLPTGANGQPPDTYVKTYLTDSTKKRTQKKKTKIVKGSREPMYRQKTKYSACNVYRRQVVASVWERSAVFDKNQSIGEVTINLDDMDLSTMNASWYRLYKRHTSGQESDSDTNMNAY